MYVCAIKKNERNNNEKCRTKQNETRREGMKNYLYVGAYIIE
jgi:hypothetical protein